VDAEEQSEACRQEEEEEEEEPTGAQTPETQKHEWQWKV
jgi:hypothetical protein